MASYDQGYEDDRFESPVSQNFHCPICLNVFKEPVMCQRNQHFFCRSCITRHLENSPTCPSCMEELTLETLTQAPRLLTGCLSELNIRCDYFNRGCRELVQLGDLESHVKDCGFTPVVCSNEGCLVEINKRDRTHHETEICEFRKVKCHTCAETRQDMDKVKKNLMTVQNEIAELKMNQKTTHDKLDGMGMNLKVVNDKLDKMEDINNKNLTDIKGQLAALPDQIRGIQTVQEKMMKEIEGTRTEREKPKFNIVIAGGCKERDAGNSAEMFNWSTKTWTQLQQTKEGREGASSFVYTNQIILTGGLSENSFSDTMESVNISPDMDSAQWCHSPAKLPGKLYRHSSVVYNGRLIVMGGYDLSECKCSDSIREVSLDPPYTNKLLTRMQEPRMFHGAELFDGKILIGGGSRNFDFKISVDSVLMYDINKNECKEMAPLPFAVSQMATVSWGDNVVAIGGVDKDAKALNTVVIYNVQSEKSHMLPAMKYKRRGCAAVVIGNAIIVMGGQDEQGKHLKSVESFSFDRYSWEELSPMNHESTPMIVGYCCSLVDILELYIIRTSFRQFVRSCFYF